MSDRGCYLRVPEPLHLSFSLIESLLGELGYRTAKDDTRIVSSWCNFEPYPIQRKAFIENIHAGLISDVLFWKDETESVFVSWKLNGDLVQFHFAFDGVDTDESCAITRALCRLLFERYPTNFHNEHALVIEL
jgi:hypothetical protein